MLVPLSTVAAGLGMFVGTLACLYGLFGDGGSSAFVPGLILLAVASLVGLFGCVVFTKRRQLVRSHRKVLGRVVVPVLTVFWLYAGPEAPQLAEANMVVAIVYGLYGLALAFEASRDHADI